MSEDQIKFIQERLVIKNGKAYVAGKAAQDGTYCIVRLEEPVQDNNEDMPDFSPDHRAGF